MGLHFYKTRAQAPHRVTTHSRNPYLSFLFQPLIATLGHIVIALVKMHAPAGWRTRGDI